MNNKINQLKRFDHSRMSESLFQSFSELIYSSCGINLPIGKKPMLAGRLCRRIMDLGLYSFDEYYDYILKGKDRENEIIRMIDAVSTNITEFFREPFQFEFLASKGLPEIFKSESVRKRKRLNVWSAGCSTGEEPYSIAIILSEFIKNNAPGYDFNILATDISTKVLDVAKAAVYKEDAIKPVPENLLEKYFIPEKKESETEYQVRPELKKHVFITRFNLMESSFNHKEVMDMIFCRNVVIYFDLQTKIEIFKKFNASIESGGYLFLGYSESIRDITKDFQMEEPTIYRKV